MIGSLSPCLSSSVNVWVVTASFTVCSGASLVSGEGLSARSSLDAGSAQPLSSVCVAESAANCCAAFSPESLPGRVIASMITVAKTATNAPLPMSSVRGGSPIKNAYNFRAPRYKPRAITRSAETTTRFVFFQNRLKVKGFLVLVSWAAPLFRYTLAAGLERLNSFLTSFFQRRLLFLRRFRLRTLCALHPSGVSGLRICVALPATAARRISLRICALRVSGLPWFFVFCFAVRWPPRVVAACCHVQTPSGGRPAAGPLCIQLMLLYRCTQVTVQADVFYRLTEL